MGGSNGIDVEWLFMSRAGIGEGGSPTLLNTRFPSMHIWPLSLYHKSVGIPSSG